MIHILIGSYVSSECLLDTQGYPNKNYKKYYEIIVLINILNKRQKLADKTKAKKKKKKK